MLIIIVSFDNIIFNHYLCIMKRHVQLPNNMPLTPQDLLIYLSIKRYMNNETKEAFPSLLTISKVSGASINTIRKGIENLKREGYIETYKRGRSQIYKFIKYTNFEPFSYEFLDKEDLSFTEKAYLVASQQYMFKNDGVGKLYLTNKELSKRINLSEPTISKCNKSLEKKDYLSIIKTDKVDSLTGLKINEKVFHLNELEQAIVFALQNHEDRIEKNENTIKSLQKELQELKKVLENK